MKTKIYIGIGICIILATVLLVRGSGNQPTDTEKTSPTLGESTNQEEVREEVVPEEVTMKFPEMQIDTNKTYKAVLSTTEGTITINLHADKTPITVNNFVYLAQQDFYNQTVFHRIIKGFMIQGGDPKGDGTGGPGYRFPDEPFEGEYKRGVVAMANAGPNTNGSQFFIMHQDYPLPKNYVIFGEVTEGIEVVDKIVEAPVTKSIAGESSTPVNPVTIKSVVISSVSPPEP